MEQTELNKSVNEILPVLCIVCNNINKHRVISSVDKSGKESMSHWDDWNDWYYWHNDFQIIECQGCSTVSFRSTSSNSEDFEYVDDYGNMQSTLTELIYPKRNRTTKNTKEFFNIPHNLRRIYREMIDCFNNENLTLCWAWVRALVEGLCIENGIMDWEIEISDKKWGTIRKRSDSLQGKINGLHEKWKLTKENADILHEHRFLWNNAMHELYAPSWWELSLAIEILEHVFDNLYEIPRKASQLKDKRLKNIWNALDELS